VVRVSSPRAYARKEGKIDVRASGVGACGGALPSRLLFRSAACGCCSNVSELGRLDASREKRARCLRELSHVSVREPACSRHVGDPRRWSHEEGARHRRRTERVVTGLRVPAQRKPDERGSLGVGRSSERQTPVLVATRGTAEL
jgi:hypothetical protein